jgi:release factor glutamine methyltransferase
MPIKSFYEKAQKAFGQAKFEAPNLEARFLLAEMLKIAPAELNLNSEVELDESLFNAYLERRLKHEPLSKIFGHIWFYGREFLVNENVLDPRPDSETLIETIINLVKEKKLDKFNILDIGTGSGCLLTTLLKEFPTACGVGVDISEKALQVARENAQKHHVKEQTNLQLADFYKQDFSQKFNQKFEVIICNPPYIDEAEKLPPATLFDPSLALFAGNNGLAAYQAIAKHLSNLLTSNGVAIFEIGQGQEDAVTQIMQAEGFVALSRVKDMSGVIRGLTFTL